MATTASSGMSGKTNGSAFVGHVSELRDAARGLSLRRGEHLQIELFIEFGDFALRRASSGVRPPCR